MHTIYLIHGMGEFASGWSKPYQDQLLAKWSLYPGLGGKDAFTSSFTFQEITYSDKFTQLRSQWKADRAVVTNLLSNGMAGGVTGDALTLLDKLYSPVTPNTFFATHLLEVLLYWFIRTVREDVLSSVAYTIASTLQSNKTTTYSVIAHSLGTSVAHDALDVLYSMPIPYGNGMTAKLTTGDAQINTLLMVANVSRLLEQKQSGFNPWDVYQSAVKPGPPNMGGICFYYYNALNRFDPIPKPLPFTLDGTWPSHEVANSGALLDLDATAVALRDIHDLDFYLENPQVHVPFFRSLTFPGAITDAQLKMQDDKFNATNAQDDLTAIRKYLSSLDIGASPALKEIIEMIFTFRSNPTG